MNTPHNWYRDNFVVSTNKSLLQPQAINAALGSDLLWWAKALPEDQLQTMLDNTFCFGLYVLPNSTADIAGRFLDTLAIRRYSNLYIYKAKLAQPKLGLRDWLRTMSLLPT